MEKLLHQNREATQYEHEECMPILLVLLHRPSHHKKDLVCCIAGTWLHFSSSQTFRCQQLLRQQ